MNLPWNSLAWSLTMETSGNCLKFLSEFAKFWRVQACKEMLYCINQCLLQGGKCVRSMKSSRKIFDEASRSTSARMQLQKICRDDVLIKIIKKLNRCVLSGMENWTVCAVSLLTSNRFMYDGVHCLAEFPSRAYWKCIRKIHRQQKCCSIQFRQIQLTYYVLAYFVHFSSMEIVA